MPAATAAADPADEPPGVCVGHDHRGGVGRGPMIGIDRRAVLRRQVGRVENVLKPDWQPMKRQRRQTWIIGRAAGAGEVERGKRADVFFLGGNRLGAQLDGASRGKFASVQAPGEIECGQHQARSIMATIPMVARRTYGKAISPVTDATGQPMKNAESQRGTKSARSPILLKVTTQLTTKTMMPVARMGKMNLALPSMMSPCVTYQPSAIRDQVVR
jgi:hypothetical protein